MSGSYIFLIHLLGFSLISAAVIAGWILNIRFSSEKELTLKLYVGGLMRPIGLLSPLAGLILLLSGIGNIYNLYYETPVYWYQQGWLVVKIILFGVMVVNGSLFGPAMTRKRLTIVKTILDEGETEERTKQVSELNRQIHWFFLVQTVLLIGIVIFSAFGTSKHPGYF